MKCKTIKLDDFSYQYAEPVKCPCCGKGIQPRILSSNTFEGNTNTAIQTMDFSEIKERIPQFLVITYLCTICDEPFISLYKCSEPIYSTYSTTFIRTEPNRYFPCKFEKIIEEISPMFCKIYNQCEEAEARNLTEICGMGYRKALEFLIKDYLIYISDNEADKKSIESKSLSKCINEHISDEEVKIISTSATWIGNDFTHYIQKLEDSSIEDIKKYINLIISSIVRHITADELKRKYTN